MWDDLKRAYYRFYFPWVRRVEFPDFFVEFGSQRIPRLEKV